MKLRRRWTDEMFNSELREIARTLGHFPSNSDLTEMGRRDLASQIQRHGGFLACAQLLGCERQRSDSDTGWEGEREAADRLSGFGFEVALRSGVKCPFDLLLNSILRIDVKSARLHRYGHSEGWFFRLGKQPQADVILLWQLDTQSFYAIPWYYCPTSNITISRSGGKYRPFFENIELLRDMIRRRTEEREALQAWSALPRIPETT